MKIAVNVCDLHELFGDNPFISQILLRDCVDRSLPSELINMDSRHSMDEGGVVLNGKAAADEARLNALVELLQTVIGPKKLGRRVRCYRYGPRGGWSEIVPKKKRKEA